MTTQKTIDIPHLGGSQIGYRFGAEYDPALPTLVLINSFTTSSELYLSQFADKDLVSKVNLLALEPYGHGATRTASEQFTYWDSAIANLQVLERLGIPSAFVLGTSQGGWIAMRMALLAPNRIKGVIPGSSHQNSLTFDELQRWFTQREAERVEVQFETWRESFEPLPDPRVVGCTSHGLLETCA